MDKKIRILVVDDEKEVRGMFEKFLTLKGYEVETASNALDALRQCNRKVPDIVVTDFQMPQMDGIALLRELKSVYPELPVIMMSGMGDMRLGVTALKEQAFDFLPKPVDSNELIAAIKLAYERKSVSSVKDMPVPEETGRIIGPVYARFFNSYPDIVVLGFNRALDEYTKISYESALDKLEIDSGLRRCVIIDLKDVKYINNVGLNLILEVYERWKKRNYKVVLTQLSSPVNKYLKMLGYLDHFRIVPNLEEALDFLG